MKVLLIKPVGREGTTCFGGPDLGFGYLAAHLRAAGMEPVLVDCVQRRLSHEGLLDVVARERPDVVGFKAFTKDIPSVRSSALRIRERHPEILILAGGPHVSAVPIEAADHLPGIDFLLAGEAENSLPRFLDLLGARRTAAGWDLRPDGFDAIPGLVHRRADGTVVANPTETVDLAHNGLPAWDLLAPGQQPVYSLRARGPYVPIQTSRGCPYRCSFCSAARLNGRTVRTRPVDQIIDELRLLKERHGIRHFSIVDDNFLGDRRHGEAFLDALLAADLGLRWEATSNGVRMTYLDPGIIDKMQRAGCYAVGVAVESGSERTLARMRKSQTVAQVERCVAMLRHHSRMHVHGFFILGYPGETMSDLAATVRVAWRLGLDSANFFLFTPHPGTEVWDELVRDGRVQGLDFANFLYEEPTLDLEGVSRWQLKAISRLAYLMSYGRWRALRGIVAGRDTSEVLRALGATGRALWRQGPQKD